MLSCTLLLIGKDTAALTFLVAILYLKLSSPASIFCLYLFVLACTAPRDTPKLALEYKDALVQCRPDGLKGPCIAMALQCLTALSACALSVCKPVRVCSNSSLCSTCLRSSLLFPRVIGPFTNMYTQPVEAFT
jgi:hypothetical protein